MNSNPSHVARRTRRRRAADARARHRGGDARRLLHGAGDHAGRDPERLPAAPSDRAQGSAAHRRALHRQPARQPRPATQRAEVLAFAQAWRREGTGGVLIDVPTGTPNERSAAAALQEVRSILAGAGVPPEAVATRPNTAERSAQARDHAPALSEGDGRRRPLRAVAVRSRSDLRARALREPAVLQPRLRATSATWRRWSTIRPTWCSRAAKSRPTPDAAPPFSTSITAAKAPRPSIPMPPRARSATSDNDHKRTPQRHAIRSRRRAHRAGAARLRAGLLRNRRDRGGGPGRRRGSAAGQGASEDPDGRHHRGGRSLSAARRRPTSS